MGVVRVDLVHPCRRAGWFGAELTRWLLATAAERPGVHLRPADGPAPGRPDAVDARVLVVRDDGRVPDLSPLTGAATVPVALVAYGGRNRGRPALARVRTMLGRAGVPTPLSSLGLNAAAVREEGFADADTLLWSLLLDDLCAGALVPD